MYQSEIRCILIVLISSVSIKKSDTFIRKNSKWSSLTFNKESMNYGPSMPFSRVHSGLLLLCPHEHLVKYRDSVKCVEEGERKKKSISIDRSFFNVKKKSQTSAQILSILSYHIQNKIQKSIHQNSNTEPWLMRNPKAYVLVAKFNSRTLLLFYFLQLVFLLLFLSRSSPPLKTKLYLRLLK